MRVNKNVTKCHGELRLKSVMGLPLNDWHHSGRGAYDLMTTIQKSLEDLKGWQGVRIQAFSWSHKLTTPCVTIVRFRKYVSWTNLTLHFRKLPELDEFAKSYPRCCEEELVPDRPAFLSPLMLLQKNVKPYFNILHSRENFLQYA